MYGSGNQIQQQRIDRALVSRVLSLLQPAEEIAVDLDDAELLDEHAFTALLQRVLRRHQANSLFARIPFGNVSGDQILGPGRDIQSSGAVLLAFHAGAGLDLHRLIAALGIDTDEAGAALYRARAAVIGDDVEACDRMRSLAGRYADPSMGQNERIALVNHANACERCGLALDEFRLLDDRLREAVESAPVTAPAATEERSALNRNPLLLMIPIVLAVVLAIAALAAISFGSATQSSASSLFAAGDPGEHRGWLILSSDQEIMAFDLERGDRRRILEHPAHDWWNPWVISPNAELAVRWEEYSRVEHRIGALRAYDMQGQRQYLHRWRGMRARTFSGWLDDRTVLFAERGPIRRVGVDSIVPDAAAPSLIAANLETGEEWAVYQGPMDKAVPSPDGNYLAVVRPAEAPWPGKTVEILPLIDDEAGEPVGTIEHRLLSWAGRIAWSDDSESIYFSAIHRDDVPDPLPLPGEPAPGPYDLERLHIASLDIDGTLAEFDTTAHHDGWVVPQAISPDRATISVALNHSFDRDDGWYHGVIALESGELDVTDRRVPGSRWWNSEAIWSPHGDELLVQQIINQRFGIDTEDGAAGSLVLQPMESTGAIVPAMVFQDTTSLNLRGGEGLALLRWVPDEAMGGDQVDSPDRPVARSPSALSQATSNQQLDQQSSIAATGRYVLLSQRDSDAGDRKRLIHLQAWAGTESDLNGTGDYAWLPREPAVIGAMYPKPAEQRPSRLIFVSTNRGSSIHELQIDPAGLGDRTDLAYRKPAVSPNGAHLAFFVQNEQTGSIGLWADLWDRDPVPIADWDHPDDARIDPSLNLHWTSNREFIHTTITQWDDGYPVQVALMRGELQDSGGIDTSEIRSFSARGRDRGIDLREVSIGHGEERIAFRVRYFSGSDPEDSASDAILVSPTHDLSQHIEIVRSGTGDGMTWLHGDRWLIAGIDERIALLEATGRESEYLSDAPAAFPVLVGPGEIWYQDLSEDGLIMRVAFD